MKRPGDGWRRGLILDWMVAAAALGAAPLLAQDSGPQSPEVAIEGAAEPAVDAGSKRLLAANGLFQRGLYKLAADAYGDFLKTYPNHAEATTGRYGLAISQYRLGLHAQAAAALAGVLADPKFKQRDEALAVQGHCCLAVKDYDKSLAAFDELLTQHPASRHAENAALSRAQVLYFQGRHDPCVAACKAFAAKYPSSGSRSAADYLAGLALAAAGKHDQAAAALADLVANSPNAPQRLDATLLLAQCLENQGKLAESADQYRAMLKTAPPDRQAEARYGLGVVLYKAGKFDDAIKELTAVAADAKSPYAAPARYQAGLAQLSAGQADAARKTLALVAARDEGRSQAARYWLAQCDVAEKKYDAAAKALEALAGSRPPPANADAVAYDLAVCRMALEDYTAAAKAFADFAAAYPRHAQAADALYRQAFCLHKLARYPESLALCDKAAAALKAAPPADATQAGAPNPNESGLGTPARLAAAIGDLKVENLFLAGKYDLASATMAELAKGAAPERKLRLSLRQGQCAFFAKDYAEAAELLGPLADDPRVARDADLSEAIFLLGDALLQLGRNTEAAAALAKYVPAAKRNNDHLAEARFRLALARLRDGQAEQAARDLAALSGEAGPWGLQAALAYGQLLYKQDKPAAAAPLLSKVVAAADAPADLAAPAAYLLAWIDYDAGRFPEAARRFAQLAGAPKRDVSRLGTPADPKLADNVLADDAAFQQAVCMLKDKKHEAALGLLEAYCKARPAGRHVEEARHLVGTCQAALGKHSEAIATLKALADDPKTRSEAVLYELAWSQRLAKDPAAVATYRKFLADYPSSKLANPVRRELAELLYAEDKFAEAAELLEKVVADKSADAQTRSLSEYRLGWCYSRLEQPAKAAPVFAAFAAEYPGSELVASACYHAGLAYALTRQYDPAIKQLTAALAGKPADDLAVAAYVKLGQAQNEAAAYADAAKTFTEFLARFPKDKFAYEACFGIGWSLQGRKQYGQAREWYGKVIAAHNGPTAARAQYLIGDCWFAEGKFEEAARELLAVPSVYAYPQWSAVALLEAGRAFKELKQFEQARSAWAECVKSYADTDPAALAAKELAALPPPGP